MGARDRLIKRLEDALPRVELRDRLAVVPGGLNEAAEELARIRGSIAAVETDTNTARKSISGVESGLNSQAQQLAKDRSQFEAILKRQEDERANALAALAQQRLEDRAQIESEFSGRLARQSVERAHRRLSQAAADAQRIDDATEAADAKAAVRGKRETIERIAAEARAALGALSASTGDARAVHDTMQTLHSLADRTAAAAVGMAKLLAGGIPGGNADNSAAAAGEKPKDSAEALAEAADRLAAVTLAAAETAAIKKLLPSLTARERLAAFVRSNAVFFDNGTGYRDEARVARALDQLARLMKETQVLVRIAGYTDERGGADKNAPLSQARADKVKAALVERGVPAGKLAAIGRTTQDLSPITGAGSPNRRVEFEVGFEGEGAE